jgi:hypothetical protein
MDLGTPGAFQHATCKAFTLKDLTAALSEASDRDLMDVASPADLAMLLAEDKAWGESVPLSERARVLSGRVDGLDEQELVLLLNRLSIVHDQKPDAKLAPEDAKAADLIIPVNRATCVGCGAGLPRLATLAEVDELRGDGEKKTSKKARAADHSDTKVFWDVVTRDGLKRAKLFYKRCAACNIMHYHDHAVKMGFEGKARKPYPVEYFVYADFDNERGYFTASSFHGGFFIETSLLASFRRQVFSAHNSRAHRVPLRAARL